MSSLFRRPGEFLDLIEYDDPSGKILVAQYDRGNHEIKQGSKLIVREGQAAIFLSGGEVADIFDEAGTYQLDTGNLPILSKLLALPYGFNSPIRSDVFFISMQQFIGNTWGTKNPIILRDTDFGMVRARAFGTYAFQVCDLTAFMSEFIGARKMILTYDIITYLSSIIVEAVVAGISAQGGSVLDLAGCYASIGEIGRKNANERLALMGVHITQLQIENISLPEEVEKMIDEQSGIHMASSNMQNFMQYQSARAMRDVAQQESSFGAGIGSLGVGMVAAQQLSQQFANSTRMQSQSQAVRILCPNCGAQNEVNDRFCSNCGASLQPAKPKCPNCGEQIESDDKFCPECGTKIK